MVEPFYFEHLKIKGKEPCMTIFSMVSAQGYIVTLVRVTKCEAKKKPETYPPLLPSPPYSRVCPVTYHTENAPAFLPVRCKGGNLCKLC